MDYNTSIYMDFAEPPSDDGPEGSCSRRRDASAMATKTRAAGRRGQSLGRCGVPENAIARYEPELHGEAFGGPDKLTERLRRALEAADGSVQKASRLGRYQLSQIQLTCSLKAGFVLLDVSGALTLSWTLPKPAP